MPNNLRPLKLGLLTSDGREVLRDYQYPTPHFGTAVRALLEGFENNPGVEVHIVSCARQPVNAPAKLAPNIYFHSLVVPKIGWMRTAFQGCVRASRKKLKEIGPDVVHGQGTEADCAISAVFSGFPNVLTIHGNMRLIAKVTRARAFSFPWLAARLERLTIPRSEGVVCITHYTRDAVAALAKRTWVLPNAVAGTFFGLRPSRDHGAPPSLMCVGVICPRKNQNSLIRSLDSVAAKMKFRMVFAGNVPRQDPYGAEFLKLVQERPWCEHLGHTEPEGIQARLREAAGLILPSLEENCPMVVLEAMAAGVPVVAAKVGGVPDLIEADRTGLFCDPLNQNDMSRQIEKLLANPSMAEQMAANARAAALLRYHPTVVARRHLEIYRELLAARRQ